jgi:hypothetical protein
MISAPIRTLRLPAKMLILDELGSFRAQTINGIGYRGPDRLKANG